MESRIVYFCKKCNRYTDVRYLSDKQGGRNKSYCYNCSDEMLIPCVVEFEENAISTKEICLCEHEKTFHFSDLINGERCVYGMRIGEKGIIDDGCTCRKFILSTKNEINSLQEPHKNPSEERLGLSVEDIHTQNKELLDKDYLDCNKHEHDEFLRCILDKDEVKNG